MEAASALPFTSGLLSEAGEAGSVAVKVGSAGSVESSVYSKGAEQGEVFSAPSVAVALNWVATSAVTVALRPGDSNSAAEPWASSGPEQSPDS